MPFETSKSKGYLTKNYCKRFFDITPEQDELLNKISAHTQTKGLRVSRSEIVRRSLEKFFQNIK